MSNSTVILNEGFVIDSQEFQNIKERIQNLAKHGVSGSVAKKILFDHCNGDGSDLSELPDQDKDLLWAYGFMDRHYRVTDNIKNVVSTTLKLNTVSSTYEFNIDEVQF